MSKITITSLEPVVKPTAVKEGEILPALNVEVGLAADGKVLSGRNSLFAERYAGTFEEAHFLAVNNLVHAAKFGQCAPLNAFYEALNTNDRTAFALYIERFQTTVDKDGFLIRSNYDFLSFNKGKGFHIKKPKVDKPQDIPGNRERFVQFAKDCLINPDGKNWTRFYQKNILSSVKEFTAAKLLSDIKSLLGKANGDSDSFVSKVPKEHLAILSNAVTSLERITVAEEKKASALPVGARAAHVAAAVGEANLTGASREASAPAMN